MNCTDCISHPRSANDLQQVEIVGGFEHFTMTIVGWLIIKILCRPLSSYKAGDLARTSGKSVFESGIHCAVVAAGRHIMTCSINVRCC